MKHSEHVGATEVAESSDTSCSQPGRKAPEVSVGHEAARGAFWTISVSVANKVLSFGSQMVLAWLLLPSDFGLVAMTMSVAGVVSVIAGPHLGTLLIQRREGFLEAAGQVFWLSLAMNVAGALVLAALSPFTPRLFGDARVAPLVLVVALACPFMALHIIYSAALYRDLRFEAMSKIQFAQSLVQNGCAVALAAAGFGAYSLVLPMLAGAILSAIITRWAAGRIPIPAPAPAQWLALLAGCFWIMVNALFNAVRAHGTSFAIGVVLKDSTVTGLYYWGYALAFQAIFVLATNLQGVLFPTLSKLNDEGDRQTAAFRKMCVVLGLVAVVVSILQVLLARPLIALVFRERWMRAIPVVQWLSVGILTQPLGTLGTSLLLARGRFGLVALTTALGGAMVSLAAALGACTGQEAEIAKWTGLGILAGNLATGWVAYRVVGLDWRSLARDFLPILRVGGPACLVAWGLSAMTSGLGSIVQGVVVSAGAVLASAVLIRTFLPQLVSELVNRVRGSLTWSPKAG